MSGRSYHGAVVVAAREAAAADDDDDTLRLIWSILFFLLRPRPPPPPTPTYCGCNALFGSLTGDADEHLVLLPSGQEENASVQRVGGLHGRLIALDL